MFITISGETVIDTGNTGHAVAANQAQRMTIDFATESKVYSPAGDYDVIANTTKVFYVSGLVATGGDLVALDPNGDVPVEFNGQVLTADATIIIPEIFIKAADLADPDDPSGPPPIPPALADGKVADPENVILLLHADSSQWNDNSSYVRTMTAVGQPQLDPILRAFGTGSLQLDEPTVDSGTGDKILSGLSTVVDDATSLDKLNIQDDSFTFEARVRFSSIPDYKEHTLFAYESEDLSFISAYITFDSVDGDTITIDWLEGNPDFDPEDPVLPPEDPLYVERYFPQQVVVPLDSGAFEASPEEFQQFVLMYDKVRGYFVAYVDGARVAFFDATQLTNPSWGGLEVMPALETETMKLSIGVPPFVTDPLSVNDDAQFVGRLDEVRLTVGETLYQSNQTTAAVYTFPWPNPIIYEQNINTSTEEPVT